MKRKRFTEEQIVAVLQEDAASPGAGRATARRHGITENTLYRWRAKYGSMQTSDANDRSRAECPIWEESYYARHLTVIPG